jgi:dipeptidyl aminopeptidase/acylaminoacyl peptidase
VTRDAGTRPPRAGDPYGLGPIGSWIAPVLSVIGLVLIGIITLNLINGDVPLGVGGNGGTGGNGNGGTGPHLTAAPSNVVVVPKEATFKGSIVYAKGGNIWIQTGDQVRQLTADGGASMPSWSPDGSSVYYIRTTAKIGLWPKNGRPAHYDLDVPDLMTIVADGSKPPARLLTGGFRRGNLSYSAWVRQPVPSPDGATIALVTDAPNPDQSNIVLQFFDPKAKRLRRATVPDPGIIGQQDPEWRPDGRYLLYVQNGRDGSRGTPQIFRYDTTTKKARVLSPTGYLQPSYSPDGRYIAATRTSALGTDVAILDAGTGAEVARVTTDGASWAPAWSPAGDGIAFLHIQGQTVDLRLAKLGGTAPSWTIDQTIDLTVVSGLDAASRPDWFIPPDQLPATPPPSVAPSVASPGASTAP